MSEKNMQQQNQQKTASSKLVPHIPLPFEEVMKDVLKVKPPAKEGEGRRKRRKVSLKAR